MQYLCLHICDGMVYAECVRPTFACTFAMARNYPNMQNVLPALLRWQGLCSIVWLTFACTFAMARKNGHFRPLSLLLSLQDFFACTFAMAWFMQICQTVRRIFKHLGHCLSESCQVLACIDHWVFEATIQDTFGHCRYFCPCLAFGKTCSLLCLPRLLSYHLRSTGRLLCKICVTDPV